MAFPLFAPRRPIDASRVGPTGVPPLPPNVRVGLARGREVAALLLWTGAVFLALALASYAGVPVVEGEGTVASWVVAGQNWVGPAGEACARSLVSLLGVVAWGIALELALLGIPFVRGKPSLATPARLGGDVLLAAIAAALVQVGWPEQLAFGRYLAAGSVGELFGELARSLFSTIGSFLVGFACLGLLLIARAAFSFIAVMRAVGRWSARGAQGTAAGARSVAVAWRAARELEEGKAKARHEAALPHISAERSDEATIAVLPDEHAEDPQGRKKKRKKEVPAGLGT